MRSGVRVFALTALIASALVSPLGGRAFGRACAAGTTHVAIIVDLGSGSSVSALCVPAGSGANGATILAARASMLGTPAPRYAASGLLCAIDGVPSTGCGVVQNGHYAYWSYWHGTGGSWSYASNGPATNHADPDVVEGWRWQPEGTARPSDPPPRGPAVASAVCTPSPPPTTAHPPTTTPHNTVTVTKAHPSTPITAANTGPPTGGTNPATRATTPESIGASAATTTPKSTIEGSSRATTTTGHGRSSTTAADPTATTVQLVPRGIAAPPGPHSSGGVPVGAIVGVILVIGLGGAGAFAARRRSRALS